MEWCVVRSARVKPTSANLAVRSLRKGRGRGSTSLRSG